ncbi:hypothetical protein PV05_02626 [Exophiala xenobiotica]|uniref:Uncharacterized protein n=1 Tax=Exophiala xenobiotica TaxID=348802 RepID=A0A0D2C035_9EURO|nr:uncharacterized protein PV05_02626 [Exophiala xenobiotica]KIW58076.1 hypothetical protein PV05_02626 [Exophiala xenobiotica]
MQHAQSSSPSPSLVTGPRTPELWNYTMGELITMQAAQFGNHTATIFSWQRQRLSYQDLAQRSEEVARSMLASGLKHGDCVAIMAGNCYQYIETFLAAARIGCPFVVLNNTYSPKEVVNALQVVPCKLLFIAQKIGTRSLAPHIDALTKNTTNMPIVLLSSGVASEASHTNMTSYSTFVAGRHSISRATLNQAESQVRCEDIVNLQFTSGTTGAPKAAMLSHKNIINNGRFLGDAMRLVPSDSVCCPPPLFHCFGLVMGFLGSVTHGSTIVFPCDQFDAHLVLDALHEEKCTALYGVPTMFIAEIEANQKKKYKITSVRTGVAAGSSVPAPVMKRLEQEFGVKRMLIAYGMTETSPVTFITSLDDSEERRTKTVGRVLPHTAAKVVDRNGKIVPRGVAGELCTSGYALQKGYYNNPEKTNEVMRRDNEGVLWMHTGDECVIDNDGYCMVTGRIKDIIIRGGENIFPLEIEERILEHPAVDDVSVVATKDDRYGEEVAAFLAIKKGIITRPSALEINQWVRKTLGSHKAPKHVFWIGDEGVGNDFPKTGSGKHQKHILRLIGNRLVARQKPKARL